MKRVFYFIGIALWLLSTNIFATEPSAAKQCNQEAEKTTINKVLLEKYCIEAGKKAEIDKNYGDASWYYLLAGKTNYLLNELEKHTDAKTSTAIYSNIGHAYMLAGDWNKMGKNYQQFLKTVEISSANNPMQADYKILEQLYTDKKAVIKQGLEQWNRIYSPYQAIDKLAQQYQEANKKQDYKKALGFLEKITSLLENKRLKNGVESEARHLAYYYNQMGDVYYRMGNYPKALEYKQKTLAIEEKVLGKQHPSTATSYNNIGVMYDSMGDSPKALEFYQKALAIEEKVLGKQHPDTASSYNNIGGTYDSMDDYPKALEFYQKSLTIREKVLGKQHPDTASSYNNIGLTYNSMGDSPKALAFYQKALAIEEKVLGKQHPDTASIYNNIGATYDSMGDSPKALEFYQKALAIREKVLGKQHPATARSYNNIGVTYKSIGDYPKALEFYQKSLTIWEKVLGKQHPDTARSYNNIGVTYQSMGDYPKALAFYQKALAIEEKVLGKQHPATARSYNNIGGTYDSMGDYSNAYHYAKKAFSIFLQQRDNTFAVLDSAQKKQYLNANEPWIDFLLLHAHHYQQSLLNKKEPQQATQLAQTTLNDWLAYKGSILDSENRLILFAKTSKDAAIQQKYQALVTLKQAYSTLHQNTPKSEQLQAWKQQLKQQQTQIATLERQITQDDPRFKTEKALQAIVSQNIANGLTEKELYIDYSKNSVGDYYVFTIDHNNQISFTAFNKKDSKAIDQQLALFGTDIEAIIDKDERPEKLQDKSKASLSQLYQLLIPPALAAKIATKESLIISPDGGLRLLPFEALYDQDKKQYLIQQKDIRYIASGKELVRLFRQQKNQTLTRNDKAVLFANPDFDKGDIKKTKQAADIYSRNTKRGKLPSVAFLPLAGTKIEAEAIIDILQKTNVRHYYHQGSATEANLLTIKQPNLLHIATHGFFNADTPNPMLQSGLVFAGANVSLEHDTGEGIVTALDLSGLDLKGTDLVVLSACETGKVDPNNTAGVSGLTKAFIQAGAKDVVMSLWQVADKETANLMTAFYRSSIANQHQYSAALKQSKLAMINDGLHPYYWAAFVLNGL